MAETGDTLGQAPPRLSAVIACYRDALAIPVMHQRLTDTFTALGVDYEIIFVNDGSPDETDAVLQAITARDPRVLAIEHTRNFGSQNAFVSGMQLARGDAVILLDGDLQDPPEVIPAFVEQWRQGYEVVYGQRRRREGPAWYAWACRAFYGIFRRVAEVPIPLDAGDFALLDRRVVDELIALPETDQFLRGLRAFVGFKQVGVDYLRPRRPFGRSNQSWRRNLWWAKKALFSFSGKPIEWLGYLGAGLTGLSLLAVGYEVVDRLRHPELPHGLSTLGVLILFLGSLQLLAIALVGEYLLKVVEETKRRPKFIRKAIRHGGEHLTTPATIAAWVRRAGGTAPTAKDEPPAAP
jgi:glycosyltransferase involved in cell wall biosynthesis